MPEITRQILRDFLNDALPDAELTAVEKAIRERPELQTLLTSVRQEVDRGDHSISSVWRGEKVSCPSLDQLGGYLLGAGDPEFHDYIAFHLNTIGCPECMANLEYLESKSALPETTTRTRQKRILDSSVGILRSATRS
ncbi:MAG: hypothetical protein LC104_10630 [Bacteroidales bacterium]|nr:hypothetical protein [Bacteroidales bacterium]